MTNVNIENIDITAFRKWQQAGNRSVKIEMGNAGDKEYCKVFVYDYDLKEGQFVHSVDEIDLEKALLEKVEKLNKELQRLKRLDIQVSENVTN